MKITLRRNIGTVDLRRFGLLTGSDPAELRKALDIYAKDRTVDVPENVHEYLLKRGLGEVTDEPLSPAPVKAVAKPAAVKGVTAPTPENFGQNPHDAPQKGK